MWLNGSKIMLNGNQVAEVIYSNGSFVIRNKRPNGTIGVCFTSTDGRDPITDFLTKTYPGYTVMKFKPN